MKHIAVLVVTVLAVSGCAGGLNPILVNKQVSTTTRADGSSKLSFTQYAGVSTDATSDGTGLLIASCTKGDDGLTEYAMSLTHFTESDIPPIERTPQRAVFRVDGNNSYVVTNAEYLQVLGNDGDSHVAIWAGSDSDAGRALFDEAAAGQDLKASFELDDDLTYNYIVDLDQFEAALGNFTEACTEL